MAGSIRVAALQLEAHGRSDFARRLDGILSEVRDAAEHADLLVLPEGTIPAYVLGREPLDWTPIESAAARLRDIARSRQTVIVAGTAVQEDGVVYNSAIVIDADGTIAGRADKIFLWHFDRLWFGHGARLAPVQTSLGPLGVLICADGRIPTIASTLVDRGALALIMPTAWVTSGRDPDALENVQADLLARVRAYENGVPFVAANKCGSELGMVAYCGKSQIIDGEGEVLAIAPEREAVTLTARIELSQRPRARPGRHAASPRRPSENQPMRIAFSFQPLPEDIDDRLTMLGARHAVAADDDERFASLSQNVAAVRAGDELVLDPAGLVPLRRAGFTLVLWSSELPSAWVVRVARARALELRLYCIAFDRSAGRAFAVDPDGSVVAGTFGDFTVASFAFDPRKAFETFVAPGTDVADGLERAAALR
ncbi:MAG: carbon-nitrogen hydrolase family protein [Candidatus Eremiobacteraeota bacterium]|nr:carbon-nitrogen hydrolase family protein [Candidatus Eremiobacteraeota bacterium]